MIDCLDRLTDWVQEQRTARGWERLGSATIVVRQLREGHRRTLRIDHRLPEPIRSGQILAFQVHPGQHRVRLSDPATKERWTLWLSLGRDETVELLCGRNPRWPARLKVRTRILLFGAWVMGIFLTALFVAALHPYFREVADAIATTGLVSGPLLGVLRKLAGSPRPLVGVGVLSWYLLFPMVILGAVARKQGRFRQRFGPQTLLTRLEDWPAAPQCDKPVPARSDPYF